jgi:protein-disulfide isomerase
MNLSRTLPLALLGVAVAGAACSGAKPSPVASPSAPPPRPDLVVATVNGVAVTESEIDKRIEDRLTRLRQQEYDLRKQALDQLIGERLVEAEARSRGITTEQLLKDEVDRQVLPPSKTDVSRIFEQNSASLGKRPRAEAEAEIEQALMDRARSAHRESFARGLREKAKVVVSLEPPRSAVTVPAGAETLGPKDARITIVEFADYQCPFCHRAQSTVDKVMSTYAGKVQLVHRDFPLDGHPNAFPAARAARCAAEQGRFWDYHRSLMVETGDLSEADLKRRAEALKLDLVRFGACLASDRYDKAIQESLDAGLKLGVTGTPAFFVNGRLLTGARPFEDFAEIIDSELVPHS